MENIFYVENNNAKLCCSCQGQGEIVLMIHGSCTNSSFFLETARLLSRDFKVILYDRRGYGKSSFCMTEQKGCSLRQQADDAKKVIDTVMKAKCACSSFSASAESKIKVIAHSSGALIALKLLQKYPELFDTILLYEPAFFYVLPKENPVFGKIDEIWDSIVQERYHHALAGFMRLIGPSSAHSLEDTDPLREKYFKSDCEYFIQNEFSLLKEKEAEFSSMQQIIRSKRILIGIGELSKDTYRWQIALNARKKYNCELIYFPSAHNCPYDLPKEFAYLATGILKAGDS